MALLVGEKKRYESNGTGTLPCNAEMAAVPEASPLHHSTFHSQAHSHHHSPSRSQSPAANHHDSSNPSGGGVFSPASPGNPLVQKSEPEVTLFQGTQDLPAKQKHSPRELLGRLKQRIGKSKSNNTSGRSLLRGIWHGVSKRSTSNKKQRRSNTQKTPKMAPSKNSGSGGQVSHRLRNFFRMNTNGSTGSASSDKEKDKSNASGLSTPDPNGAKRHTKFFSNTVGRLRAHTVASEGNQVEETLSPTAHANPYFAHQGQPGLRHHNAGSVPPSPPDTPTLNVQGPDGTAAEQATSETKEELARRLRRVASAPNAQGMFSKDAKDGQRPATAELGKDPLIQDTDSGSLSLVEAKVADAKAKSLGIPTEDSLSALPAPSTALAFRRTYSSNSIKVRNVEVSPSSFDKIKLIGKGDVGKVYLVREKKSSRLYAMKGLSTPDLLG